MTRKHKIGPKRLFYDEKYDENYGNSVDAYDSSAPDIDVKNEYFHPAVLCGENHFILLNIKEVNTDIP